MGHATKYFDRKRSDRPFGVTEEEVLCVENVGVSAVWLRIVVVGCGDFNDKICLATQQHELLNKNSHLDKRIYVSASSFKWLASLI